MKKMKLMLFAVAAIAAASCAKETAPENTQNGNAPELDLIPMTFTAGSESTGTEDNANQPANISTRVALQSDGTTLHWEAGDKIKVFDGVSNDLEPFTASESGKVVKLEGNVTDGSTEFYAVYPSTAANGFNAETKTLTVTLPETQTSAEGSVPKNAFITVAKSDNQNNFAFKNLTAFVKFSLSDATNVKEVTISGNAGESLTGDMTVTIGADGTPSQSYVSNKMNSTATLKGNFVSETDYYIAVRSADFAKGLTVSIYMNDGSNSSRVYLSSPTAPEQRINRNSILDLGNLNVDSFKTTAPKDQYLAYLHGYNVEIGDVKLHKTSGIAPKLVTAKSAAQELRNEFHDKTGDVLLFLEQNEGCSFKIGSPSNIKGNVRLVGRKSKVDITNNGFFQAIQGCLMLKNINFTLGHTGAFATNNSDNTTATLSKFYIQDCTISNLQSQLYNSPNATYGISDIYLKNNDIEIASATQLFNGIKAEVRSFKMEQNVIYNTSENGVDFAIFNGNSTTINTIEIKYNTIGKCNPNWYGYVYINTAGSATITNNLFYLPGLPRNAAIFRPTTYPTSGKVSGNFCEENTAYNLNALQESTKMENTGNYSKSENKLTENSDIDNGYYQSNNATYGATR